GGGVGGWNGGGGIVRGRAPPPRPAGAACAAASRAAPDVRNANARIATSIYRAGRIVISVRGAIRVRVLRTRVYSTRGARGRASESPGHRWYRGRDRGAPGRVRGPARAGIAGGAES